MIEFKRYLSDDKIITEERGKARFIRLHKGDEFFVSTSTCYPLGYPFENHPDTIVICMHYEPKKWWQFWKKKKPIGCTVRYWPKEERYGY